MVKKEEHDFKRVPCKVVEDIKSKEGTVFPKGSEVLVADINNLKDLRLKRQQGRVTAIRGDGKTITNVPSRKVIPKD